MATAASKVEELVRLLNLGTTVATACNLCQIPISTYYTLRQIYPELCIDRGQIMIEKLIETIKNNPDWNNQEICDHCEVNITSFYKYMKKSLLLREIRAETIKIRQRTPHFDSFYAQQLYKSGYPITKIKNIIKSRNMNNILKRTTNGII